MDDRRARASARTPRGRRRCRRAAASRSPPSSSTARTSSRSTAPRNRCETSRPIDHGVWYSSLPGEPLEQQRRRARSLDLLVDRAALLARGRRRRSATRARRRSPARSRARRCTRASRSAGRPRTRSTAGDPSRGRPRRRPAQHAWSARTAVERRSRRRRRAAATRPGRAAFRRDRRRAQRIVARATILARWRRSRETEPWAALLEKGRTDERLVHDDFYEARSARGLSLCRTSSARASAGRLRETPGSTELYAHQAQALEDAFEAPTIVTTGTASGKSLCFQLPTLRGADLRPHGPRALPVPDQGARPGPGAGAARVRAAQADPARRSTTATRRARSASAIRKRSNLILTNPDMLHVGILPHHPAWGDLFANLAFVVVDEAHVYRGVFGSHVANVLRRLRRIAAIHGTEPRFLLASATIANPRRARRAADRPRRLQARSTSDGAPRAAGASRCGTRRCSTRSSGSAARRCTRRPRCSRS